MKRALSIWVFEKGYFEWEVYERTDIWIWVDLWMAISVLLAKLYKNLDCQKFPTTTTTPTTI